MTESWQCPYCGHFQILLNGSRIKTNLYQDRDFVKASSYGAVGLEVTSIAYLNSTCKKLTLKADLVCLEEIEHPYEEGHYSLNAISVAKSWHLLPDSIAKPQPKYIPKSIREDYEEACKIAHLSPKASATMARRCLQGMIRDFCKIKKNTLYQEIEELKNNLANSRTPQGVTIESIEAIDNIRALGNIGAHMKMDANILADISKDEATSLIELIEMLLKEWYVAKHQRNKTLKKLQKSIAKKQPKEKTPKKKVESLLSDMDQH